MESLERLRRRFDSFEDLQSVVRTMKTLAAVNIHHYEQAVRALSVYYRTVELGLHVVLRDLQWQPRRPLPPGAPAGAVVFGSDHGLCGRFNEDVSEHAVAAFAQRGRPRLLAVGARVAYRLEVAGFEIDDTLTVPGSAAGITACVRKALVVIDGWRADGIERVDLVFSRHLSSSAYAPVTQQLMPVDFSAFRDLESEPWGSKVIPTYSMERDALLAALLRQYFFVAVFRASAESLASETGARLVAMQAAEKNLGERQGELGTALRRARQDQITAELLDLVAGYELASGA